MLAKVLASRADVVHPVLAGVPCQRMERSGAASRDCTALGVVLARSDVLVRVLASRVPGVLSQWCLGGSCCLDDGVLWFWRICCILMIVGILLMFPTPSPPNPSQHAPRPSRLTCWIGKSQSSIVSTKSLVMDGLIVVWLPLALFD